jgi:hypothetical protein
MSLVVNPKSFSQEMPTLVSYPSYLNMAVGVVPNTTTTALYYILGTSSSSTVAPPTSSYEIKYATLGGTGTSFITQQMITTSLAQLSPPITWQPTSEVIQSLIFDPTLGFDKGGKLYILTTSYILAVTANKTITVFFTLNTGTQSTSVFGGYGIAFDSKHRLFYSGIRISNSSQGAVLRLDTSQTDPTKVSTTLIYGQSSSNLYYSLTIDSSQVYANTPSAVEYLYTSVYNQPQLIKSTIDLQDQKTIDVSSYGITKVTNLVATTTGLFYASVVNTDGSVTINQYTSGFIPIPVTNLSINGTTYVAATNNKVATLLGKNASGLAVSGTVVYYSNNGHTVISSYDSALTPTTYPSYLNMTLGVVPTSTSTPALYYILGTSTNSLVAPPTSSYEIKYATVGSTTGTSFITQQMIITSLSQLSPPITWNSSSEVIQSLIFDPTLGFDKGGKLYILTTNYILAVTANKIITVFFTLNNNAKTFNSFGNYGLAFDTKHRLYFSGINTNSSTNGGVARVDTSQTDPTQVVPTLIYANVNNLYNSLIIDSSQVYANTPSAVEYLYTSVYNQPQIIKSTIDLNDPTSIDVSSYGITNITNMVATTTGLIFANIMNTDGSVTINKYTSGFTPVPLSILSSTAAASSNVVATLVGENATGLAVSNSALYYSNNGHTTMASYNYPFPSYFNMTYGYTPSNTVSTTPALYYIRGTSNTQGVTPLANTYEIYYVTSTGTPQLYLNQQFFIDAVNRYITAFPTNPATSVWGTSDYIQSIIFDPTLGYDKGGKMWILTTRFIFTASVTTGVNVYLMLNGGSINVGSATNGNYGLAFDMSHNLYYSGITPANTTMGAVLKFDTSATTTPTTVLATNVYSAVSGYPYLAVAIDSSQVYLNMPSPKEKLFVTYGTNNVIGSTLGGNQGLMNCLPTSGVTKYTNIATTQSGYYFAVAVNTDGTTTLNQYDSTGQPLPITTLLPDGTYYTPSSSNVIATLTNQKSSGLAVSGNKLYYTNNGYSTMSTYTLVIQPPTYYPSYFNMTAGVVPNTTTPALYYIVGKSTSSSVAPPTSSYEIKYVTLNSTSGSSFVSQDMIAGALSLLSPPITWNSSTEVIQSLIFDPTKGFDKGGKLYILTTNYILSVTADKIITVFFTLNSLNAGTGVYGNYGMTFDSKHNLYYTGLTVGNNTQGALLCANTIVTPVIASNIYSPSPNVIYNLVAIDSSQVYSEIPSAVEVLYVASVNNGVHQLISTLIGSTQNQKIINSSAYGVARVTNMTITTSGIIYANVVNTDGSVSINQYTSNFTPVPVTTRLPNGTPYTTSSNAVASIVGQNVTGMTVSDTSLYFSNNNYSTIASYTPPDPTPTPPTPTPMPDPYGNICFPENTPINTDQGVIAIQKINTSIHTIKSKPIVAVTRTLLLENFLVCFEPHSLRKNYPSQRIIMSGEHKVKYNGELTEARKFIGQFEGVKAVKYNGQVLYNILLDTHEFVKVNGMVCETLHPKNAVARLYNSSIDESTRVKLINEMNDKLVKGNFDAFKKTVSKYISK